MGDKGRVGWWRKMIEGRGKSVVLMSADWKCLMLVYVAKFSMASAYNCGAPVVV